MHIEVAGADQDRTKAFCTEHFGCRVAADQPMGSGGWRSIGVEFANAETVLHFIRRKEDVPSGRLSSYASQKTLGRLVKALKSRGVKIMSEPVRLRGSQGTLSQNVRAANGIA